MNNSATPVSRRDLAEQVQDLGLDRDVLGGDGLVNLITYIVVE